MKKVRNSANPANTWLGGTVDSPSAFFVILKTMMIRTKLVIMIKSAGATDNSVSKRITTKLSLGLVREFPKLIETVGRVVVVVISEFEAR